jgi:hypothetical protein
MRHDDSSKRPRVDPAQNPRLAAALSRLSNGIRESISENPSSRPAAAVGLIPPSSSDDEVYVPDNDEIELLDDGPETVQRAGSADFEGEARSAGEEEMVPTSGELELTEGRNALNEAPPPPSLERVPTPSFRQGVIAYGAPLPPDPPPEPVPELLAEGDEVLEPSDSELELVDPARPPESQDGYGGALPDGAPYAEGELDETPLYTPAEPSDEVPADEPAEAAGGSPWAAAAAEKAIDVRALPSSLAPITPAADADKQKASAEPAVGSPGKPGRSWLTIFLALALAASVVTFLLLKFNVVEGPEGRPSADTTPIQVPTSAPAATQAPAVPPPEPTATAAAAPEPVVTADPEPSSVAAEPEASAVPGAGQGAAPGATSTAAAAPGGPVPGKAPTVGTKPSGPSQSGKKPSRIF